jgi:hypothetical protein
MGSLRNGLLTKKPKELLPLPTSQWLQQRLHQSLDLGLTVFGRPGSRMVYRDGLVGEFGSVHCCFSSQRISS